MNNKHDLASLNEINTPQSLDDKVLAHARGKLTSKNRPMVKLAASFAGVYCLGIVTMLGIEQVQPVELSVDNISAHDINLQSLRVETRSSALSKAHINLETLDSKQLKQIAQLLASKEQWHELEKLTLYIQKKEKMRK